MKAESYRSDMVSNCFIGVDGWVRMGVGGCRWVHVVFWLQSRVQTLLKGCVMKGKVGTQNQLAYRHDLKILLHESQRAVFTDICIIGKFYSFEVLNSSPTSNCLGEMAAMVHHTCLTT